MPKLAISDPSPPWKKTKRHWHKNYIYYLLTFFRSLRDSIKNLAVVNIEPGSHRAYLVTTLYILNIPNLLKAGEWQNYPPLAPWQQQMTKFWALVEFYYQIRKVHTIHILLNLFFWARGGQKNYNIFLFSVKPKKNTLFENWLYTRYGFPVLQARFSIKLILKSWFLVAYILERG